MAVFHKGDIAVDLQTGAQFDVAEDGDLDESRYGRMEPGTKATPEEIRNAKPVPGTEQGLIPPQIAKPAQQAAVQEATQTSGQLFRNVAVPAAQAGLMAATGGMSLPAQMAIGAGSEYLAQQAGASPKSMSQVALQGAMPIAGRAIEGAKGGFRMIANLAGKGQKAGEQAAADVMRVTPDVVERAGQSKASALYGRAEQAGNVQTSNAAQAIQDAIDAEKALGSQADKATIKYLEGVKNDLAGGEMDAATLVAKAQRLQGKTKEAFLKKSPTRGEILKGATSGMKEAVPGLKEADVAYTREGVVDKLFSAMRKSRKVEAIDELLQKEGSKIKGVMSDDEIRDLRLIASRIHNFGSDAGVLKSGLDATLKSFLADPNGLTVFRHAFGPTMERLKPERLAGLLTFIRGYEAQKRRKD